MANETHDDGRQEVGGSPSAHDCVFKANPEFLAWFSGLTSLLDEHGFHIQGSICGWKALYEKGLNAHEYLDELLAAKARRLNMLN